MADSKEIVRRETLYELLSANKEAFDKMSQSIGTEVPKVRFAEYMRRYKRGQFNEFSQIVTSTLVGTKILDEIVYGAEYAAHEGRVGREMARPVSFGDQVVVRVPKYTAGGYAAVGHGYAKGQPIDLSNPASYTEFTVSDDSKTHRHAVQVTENALRDANWDEVQNQLFMLGESMGAHENYDILQGFDTASTQAWATDAWVTLVNGMATALAAGFYPDRLCVGAAGYALLMKLAQFISADYLGKAGQVMQTGQIGRLILGCDVFYSYFVDLIPATGGKATWGVLTERNKGVGFGLKQDLEVRNFENILAGLEGAVASMRYDVKIINTTAAVQLLAA